MKEKKHILVAVLNWGLGHATRSIPIINLLIDQGHKVSIASDGRALNLLKKEFPLLPTYSLPAYDITYSRNGKWWSMALQLTKLPRVIKREYNVIQRLVAAHNIDCIISDHRLGCYAHSTYNVIISHQVFMKAPFSSLGTEYILEKINAAYLRKFQELWIPDVQNNPNLSGDLSHKKSIKDLSSFFIGPLSRFKYSQSPLKYDAAIILSGPEPQRSILEKLLLAQAKKTAHKIILVRGVTEGTTDIKMEDNLSVVDYLYGEALNTVILKSKVIISRSGYTTLMDIVKLNKAAIFIPTPGQTEQIYLAEKLKAEGVFYSATQSNFNLTEALDSYSSYLNKIEILESEDILNERIKNLGTVKT